MYSTTTVRIAIVQNLTSEGGVGRAYSPAFSPHLPCHFLSNNTALAGGGNKCIVKKEYYSLGGLCCVIILCIMMTSMFLLSDLYEGYINSTYQSFTSALH